MKLLTKKILSDFAKQGDTSMNEPEDTKVIAKFFGGGRWSWYAVEYDVETGIMFGFVQSGLGPDCDELGSFSWDEISSVKFPPFNLGIERDSSWNPKTTLRQVMSGEKR
jgi:hypothetical protein